MPGEGNRRQFFLGPEARREMSEMYAWYRRHMTGDGGLPDEPKTKFGARLIRIAKTTTGATPSGTFPTYPSRPANTFVVEFGETHFDEEAGPGLSELEFTPYDPAEKRVARDMYCNYHEENSLVFITLIHDQWHIICPVPELLAFGELGQDLCDETTSIAVDNVKGYPFCNDLTHISTLENPRGRRGASGGKVVAIKKQCKDVDGNCGTDEEWEILAIEKRKLCVKTFIEDRESCLVDVGLATAAEWCPPDEPDAACPIVEYTDCDEELPECDTDYTFDPLDGCC